MLFMLLPLLYEYLSNSINYINIFFDIRKLYISAIRCCEKSMNLTTIHCVVKRKKNEIPIFLASFCSPLC